MYKSKAKQGTMYKGSKALCTKQQNMRCTKGEILGKAAKEKTKHCFWRGRNFPKYFISKSRSVLPLKDFKLPISKYRYDATVVVNQNQFLSKI